MKCLKNLEKEAAAHHDLRSLKICPTFIGWIIELTGDIGKALTTEEQALQLALRSGDFLARLTSQNSIARCHLDLGHLAQAENYARRALNTLKSAKHEFKYSLTNNLLGTIALCRNSLDEAAAFFERAIEILEGIDRPYSVSVHRIALARAYLSQGKRLQAFSLFQEAASSKKKTRKVLVWNAWNGLEQAFGDARSFRALCQRMRDESGEKAGPTDEITEYVIPSIPFVLEPANVRMTTGSAVKSDFLPPDWTWQDPFGDCSCSVQDGLEIRAANGRDLYHINLSAARLMRPVSGSFAFQATCLAVSDKLPRMGGILLRHDKQNYLILQIGRFGRRQVFFGGCLDNRDMCIGQGTLRGDVVLLRLERMEGEVRALCSADGASWLTAGSVAFPTEDPVSIGLHATGHIDRTIYHGAFTEGTAIRFESVELAQP